MSESLEFRQWQPLCRLKYQSGAADDKGNSAVRPSSPWENIVGNHAGCCAINWLDHDKLIVSVVHAQNRATRTSHYAEAKGAGQRSYALQ